LASASVFFTGRPCTTSRTAISVILPERVREMSPTWMIFAGTSRGLCADLPANALLERLVERCALNERHEQHDAHIVLPVLADADRLDHFGNLLDLRIDFRRADAHAGRIERRIGAAIDDHAAVLRPFGEIAMRPDSKRPPN
jgi:hypothetical protein